MASTVATRTPTTTVGVVAGWALFAAATTLLIVARPGGVAIFQGAFSNGLFLLCGTLIVLRTPQRMLGGLMMAAGSGFALALAFHEAKQAALLPAGTRLEAIGPFFLVALILFVLLFPSGELPNRAALAVAWLTALSMTTIAVLEAFLPTPQAAAVREGSDGVALIALVAAVAIQIAHVRHRGPVERRQVAWFLYAIVIMVALYSAAVLLGVPERLFALVDGVATCVLPIAVLVAVTRYRLYEIDRIVSRTVSYALLIGLLAAAYLAVLAAVHAVLPAQSSLGVALSTLTAVALFHPVRRRLHDAIDRRFNRAAYDARQVVDDFARDSQFETDVPHLVTRIHDAVGRSIEPATVATWLPHRPARSAAVGPVPDVPTGWREPAAPGTPSPS